MVEASDFIRPRYRYAVIGATTDQAKYGYRVMMDLHRGGLFVVGVNPKYKDIEGVPVVPTVADTPEKTDVAVFVVPPEVGVKLLEGVKTAGVEKVWFQPGAESDEIRAKISELGLMGMADGSCIMVERRALKVGTELSREF